MCGIAGEIRFDKGPSQADWELVGELMRRRGPDDSGLWTDDAFCTLCFRRLAILDLSQRGHQPMLDDSGRFALVFNGEIYNFRELKKTLESEGVIFRSNGDTEVVLQALMCWGRDALDRFNGIFAIAFYDLREKSLLLARDHAGIKPLYYLRDSRGVVFGSQFNQLLAHPWSKKCEVDQKVLGLYLRLGYIPAPFGLLKNTRMLEPGHWLRIDAGGQITGGCYWSMPLPDSSPLQGEEAFEAVDSAITSAVARQLISDVPVGAFLSGGIDSPLVVAKMVEAGHPHIRTFTIGTQDDQSDESEDARRYAKSLGVEQVVERISTDRALELLPEVVESASEPFGDYSIFPTMLVSRLASREFKVMLSGDGGDELFWGYAHRSGQPIKSASVFETPYFLRHTRALLRRLRGKTAGPSLDNRTIGDWYLNSHTRLKAGWLEKIFPTLPGVPQGFVGFHFNGHDQHETAQWLRQNEFAYHLTMVLLKVDRASMHYSQEVRVPLLDREVIDVALQVDWRSCIDIRSGTGKKPLRHCLATHVDSQTSAKKGFEAPMADWLRGPLREQFETLVLQPGELLGQSIDPVAIRAAYEEHLSGLHDHARGLWPLLSLALWEKAHFEHRYS